MFMRVSLCFLRESLDHDTNGRAQAGAHRHDKSCFDQFLNSSAQPLLSTSKLQGTELLTLHQVLPGMSRVLRGSLLTVQDAHVLEGLVVGLVPRRSSNDAEK